LVLYVCNDLRQLYGAVGIAVAVPKRIEKRPSEYAMALIAFECWFALCRRRQNRATRGLMEAANRSFGCRQIGA
jgi:hypothetical protein